MVASCYHDFTVKITRITAKNVAVDVLDSPAGPLAIPVIVPFTGKRVTDLKNCLRRGGKYYGLDNFKQENAEMLGKELSAILLPLPVISLFSKSLARLSRTPGNGLRIRIVTDDEMVDLPWEYLYRPDRLGNAGLSGFLLLDPAFSIVRGMGDPGVSIKPVKGKQLLEFAGTFWGKDRDVWDVRGEYEKITDSLKPVSSYIGSVFKKSDDAGAFKVNNTYDGTIFHYAGHCDVDEYNRSYLVTKMPDIKIQPTLRNVKTTYLSELVTGFYGSNTRLVVLSACNSGFRPVVKPWSDARIPAIIGINGIIAAQSTIEFCKKLYESLSVGLSLDEAVGRARLHVLAWDQKNGFFDWGLYMVYMCSPDAVLFPKSGRLAEKKQVAIRKEHKKTADRALTLAELIDGVNFSEILSLCSKNRVFILGRFNQRRLAILEQIKKILQDHPNNYKPELFTYEKPVKRDLVESAGAFAALSKFVIADISEASGIQVELNNIAEHFPSVPVIPIINKSGKEYAMFAHAGNYKNIPKHAIRYLDADDLARKMKTDIIPLAEKMYAATCD